MNGMLILLIKIDDFSQFINKWVEIKYRILSKVNQNYVRSILGCCDDAKECEVGCFNRIGQLFRRTVQIIHKVIIGLFILDSISLALYVNK
ncbi:hypothetical protein ECANGB1_2124 [Enterospora canceri]|uniref:Uncharacterized protein n=1 Tax=Enterospora canceri TaxID=1081671 RepID=A0A1Y1S527_9MICR|nr:hypothetical protein ECANGB1_2124 [Enterospora canceri]